MAMFAWLLTAGMAFGMQERWVLVPLGDEGIKLTRRDGGIIRTVTIPDETVIRVSTIGGAYTIRVFGLKPGMTPITLIDREEREEKLLLIVLPKGAVRPRR